MKLLANRPAIDSTYSATNVKWHYVCSIPLEENDGVQFIKQRVDPTPPFEMLWSTYNATEMVPAREKPRAINSPQNYLHVVLLAVLARNHYS